MERTASQALDRWLVDPGRLPLVVRGARQVGKTWLVRDLAGRQGLDLAELNFERDPSLARLFESNDPRQILGELAIALGQELVPKACLLFLDEIQAAGGLLPKLRWFAEEMPELALVAAGSLLEFTLADHDFSMPVGRVTYLHLQPMTYTEYLAAQGQDRLLRTLRNWSWSTPLTGAALEAAWTWFHRYAMVGGMPAIVRADREGAPPADLRRLQSDLLATFLDDFGRYAGRMSSELLDATLRSVARQLGRKFVYADVVPGVRSDRARRALELLANARLCHIVEHTAANGLPLGGEVKRRNRKVVLLDVGLAHAMYGTPATQTFPAWNDLAPATRGALTEQIVGQQLLTLAPDWTKPTLFYWQRGAGRPGEIDYLIQMDDRIVPIEAKSGASGALKSLHQFMHDKGLDVAVRTDANPPSRLPLELETTQGDLVAYSLLNLPHFLVWQVPRALET